nr:MAG TPA: Protein of unknown function (DUF1056) [Caudoviricetes sp.]
MRKIVLDLLILALQLSGVLLIGYAVAQVSAVAAMMLGGGFLIWLGSVLYRASRENDGKGGNPE